MRGRGSRRNSGQSFGSDGRAVNVWRTSPERLRGGTRAAFIECWQSMEALLPRHAEWVFFGGGEGNRTHPRSIQPLHGSRPLRYVFTSSGHTDYVMVSKRPARGSDDVKSDLPGSDSEAQ